MAQYQTRDYVLIATHLIALLFALGVTLTTMILVVTSDGDHTPFHITNTLLSKYDSESPLNTYIPVSEPPSVDSVQRVFYTCLMQSEVAVDSMYNCRKDSLTTYQTCVDSMVTPTFRVQRMLVSIKQILGEYDGKSVEVVQLPTWLTSADTTARLQEMLAANATRYALKQQLATQSTSLAVRILETINTAETMSGLPACFDRVKTTFLTEYSASYDLSTAFDSLWKCTSDLILVQPIHKRAYQKCIPLSAWPAKDIMQNPYSDTLFGSYNKYFVLWIATWLLTSFAVYTSPGWPSPASENGKPKYFFARAGKAMVSFGFVWNLAAVIIVVIRTFAPASSFKDAPMSIQTAFLTLFFTISASVYFGREVYELFFLSDKPPEFKFMGTSTTASATFSKQRRQSQGRVYQGISAFMEPTSASADVPDEEYSPLVAPVWNDAWFFTDALLFLSVVGTSYDTVTVDIVVCVFCIMCAALCNSALVRLLYEGYIKLSNRSGPAMKDASESIFVVRVMAVIACITALFFSIVIIILVAMRFGAKLITFYSAFTSLVPQVIWLAVVLSMEYGQIRTNKGFFWTTSSCFGANVVIRMVFVTMLLSTFNYDYKKTVGDDDSLYRLLSYVNTDSSSAYSYVPSN